MSKICVRKKREQDHVWIDDLIREKWVVEFILSRGRKHIPGRLPGLVATVNEQPRGLLTFHIVEDEFEIVTLNSLQEGKGIGNLLVRSAIEAAEDAGCKRVWLITTNDNTDAMLFYQKLGFRFSRIHRDGVVQARRIEPSIPQYGHSGIRIIDEVEMDYQL